MSGRQALVIASECKQMAELGFVETLARDLQTTLLDPDLGGWSPALGDRSLSLLLNPSVVDLKATVKAAFRAADKARAALLVAFIGHGITISDDDYYLLVSDSSCESPDSDTAYHLVQQVREALNTATRLDGLVWLVDACEAAGGIKGAGARWVTSLVTSGGRMELLVASGDDLAYEGCFSRTLIATMRAGLRQAGEYLLFADVKPVLTASCPKQTAQLLSYDGVRVIDDSTDKGLYLVMNAHRRNSPLTGSAAAGLVDQLTRGVVMTDQVVERFTELVENDAARLRAVIGPAGSGKSTLVSLLLRSELVPTAMSAPRLDAVVFLDPSSDVESIARELSAQLSVALPGFGEASAQLRQRLKPEELRSLPVTEAEVCRPLEACRTPGQRVRMLIDGLDQPDLKHRELVLAEIAGLADPTRSGLSHVRVIVTARDSLALTERPGMQHAHVIAASPLSRTDLEDLICQRTQTDTAHARYDELLSELPDGGWLIARLLSEIEDRFLP